MSRRKIFFVVGHRHWGKSTTIRSLTRGRIVRHVLINSNEFFIRRTSNDDVLVGRPPTAYYEFLKHLHPERKPLVIAALCPNMFDKRLLNHLRHLRGSYRLFFFVLQRRWDGKKEISAEEIGGLRKLGRIFRFKKQTEAKQRANSLRSFILGNI